MIHGIWIHGKPVPKGRPRFARNGGVYTPKTTADYEKRIAEAWRDKYGDKQVEPHNLVIHVDVYTKRYSTSDVDNFLKVAMDGLQGVRSRTTAASKRPRSSRFRSTRPAPTKACASHYSSLVITSSTASTAGKSCPLGEC
jgi:hypothetical protein